MAEPKPSLSPSRCSDGAFERFVDKNAEALDEADVMANAFPIMRGQSDIPSGIKRTFGNLAVPMDGTLVDAQPDFYYGARPDQLDSRVQEKLNSYIVPSVNDRAPVLRNNFTKGKGPGGTWAVAGRQARYDGALGARGMQQLQSDGQPEPDYDSNADTITSTFDGEHLHIYTTHPTAPTNLEDTFRQGATAFRNARDWAREERDEFIDAATKRAANLPRDISFGSSGYSEPSTSANRVTALESDTSVDEVALDDDVIPHPSKRLRRGNGERDGREDRSGRRGRYTR